MRKESENMNSNMDNDNMDSMFNEIDDEDVIPGMDADDMFSHNYYEGYEDDQASYDNSYEDGNDYY